MINKTLDPPEVGQEESKHETAYIYNGYSKITLPYLGAYTYEIPYREVTTIRSVEHKEVDQSKSFDGNSVYVAMHLPGESIARELIETRKFNQKGCAVFFDGPDVPSALKDKCDSEGLRHALGEIQAFKVNREKAKAGTAGFKIKPDRMILEWMEIHTPDDEVFASQSQKTDSAAQTAFALQQMSETNSKLTDIVVSIKAAERLEMTRKDVAAKYQRQEPLPEPVVEEPVPESKPKRGRPRKDAGEAKTS
jgi:hypothetical protein